MTSMLNTHLRAARRKLSLGIRVCLSALLVLQPALSDLCRAENPTGGAIVAGAGTISNAGSTLNVMTTSDRAIINWQSFSIGQGHTTNFQMPGANAAVLNRVVTSNPSAIYGTLNANGNVFLVNPSGVLVGASGMINTNGFTASVLDISNSEFMKGGSLTFGGDSMATVTNLGSIITGSGGATLIGGQVMNSGLISSEGGSINLVTGNSAQLSGGVVYTQADQGTVNNGISETAGLIRNTGVVRATGALEVGGEVYLVSPGGSVMQEGLIAAQRVNASSTVAGTPEQNAADETAGGKVVVTGADVVVSGEIDASGEHGGGQVHIGGGFQGSDPSILNSESTLVTAGAMIRADATVSGDGGTVTLWSDGETAFHGIIAATGAPLGSGGLVEVSGKQSLRFAGQVDTRGGQLLLDPYDYVIDVTEAAFITSALASNNVTIQTDVNDPSSGATGPPSGNGDITILAPISWTSNNTLTLLAQGDVDITADVQADSSGSLNVVAGWDGATAYSTATFLAADPLTTTIYGQNNGGVAISSGAAAGSRHGETNVFAESLHVLGSGGNSQLGFRAPSTSSAYSITGGINVRTTGDVNVESLGNLAQIGHVGTGRGGSQVTVDAPITIAAAGDLYIDSNVNQTSTQIGHGGKGSGGDFSGDITVTVDNFALMAGNGGDPSQLGHGSFAAAGVMSGTIDLTVTGDLTADGESNLNRYSLVGHGGGSAGGEVSGDIFVHVGGSITTKNTHIGSLVTNRADYTSGNTYMAVAQIDNTGTFTSVEDSSYWSADNGELRFYMPGAGSWTADGGSTLVNGVLGSNVYELDGSFKNEVGVYQPWNGGYLGTPADNYSFYFTDPIELVVRALSGSSIYGDTPSSPGLVLDSGSLQDGDTLASIGLSTDFALTSTSPVGGSVIQVTGAGSVPSETYNVTMTVDGLYTINPAPLTIMPTAQSKTFGDAYTLDTTAFTAAGLKNGEIVTNVALSSSGSPATAGAGSYDIAAVNVLDGANGFQASNYAIAYGTLTGGLTVEKAALAITPTAQSKTYGDAFVLDNTAFTVTGLVNSNSVDTVTMTSPGTATTADVGAYDITAVAVGSASGGFDAANYDITYNVLSSGLTVNPAPLLIMPTAQSKSYGEEYTLDPTAFTAGGLVNGEQVFTVQLISAGASASAPAGQYDITATDVLTSSADFDPNNYSITYGTLTDALTVGTAVLTITPTSQSKVYGDAYTLDGTAFTAAGLLNGDTLSEVALTSPGTPAAANVGAYDITATGVVAAGGSFDESNYSIVYDTLPGGLTVTPAPLSIMPTSQSKTFGQALVLDDTAFTASGLLNGNTVTNVSMTSSGAGASAGAGSYEITATGITGSGGGFLESNYNITYGTLDNALTIDRAALAIIPTAQGKSYGQNYTLDPTGFNAVGLQNGDAVTAVNLSSDGTPAPAAVGQYDITATGIAGGSPGFDAANYDITFETLVDGLTVGTAVLTITPTFQTVTYGEELDDTAFTATGLLNGNTINTVDIVVSGGSQTPDVGVYDLTATAITSSGNGFDSGNYTIVYNSLPGGLTVAKAELTYYVPDQFKPFQTVWVPGPGSIQVDGLVNGDTFGTLPMSSPGGPKPAPWGVYPIDVLGPPTGGTFNPDNYNVTFLGIGRLFVSPYGTSLYTYDRFTRYDDFRSSIHRLYMLGHGAGDGQMPHEFAEHFGERDGDGDADQVIIPAMRFHSS